MINGNSIDSQNLKKIFIFLKNYILKLKKLKLFDY